MCHHFSEITYLLCMHCYLLYVAIFYKLMQLGEFNCTSEEIVIHTIAYFVIYQHTVQYHRTNSVMTVLLPSNLTNNLFFLESEVEWHLRRAQMPALGVGLSADAQL